MRRLLFSVAMMSAAMPAIAQHIPVPIVSAEEARGHIPEGAKIESRVDGDLNGDGEIDTVFIWRKEVPDEARGLKVLVAYRAEFDLGHDPAGDATLDPSTQGLGTLSIRKGVLILEDLTGGTTATQSTRRYRYDAKKQKMRLIGIDAQRYSRSNSHGTVKLSWNLLDGTHIVERGELNTSGKGDEAILYAKPDRTSQKTPPVWMEDAPDPDSLLDAEIAPEGEDRD